MTEPTALAHTNDPDTSHDAAARATHREELKNAILWMLHHRSGRNRAGLAAFEAIEEYVELRNERHWPDVQLHSIPRRMSELHKEGRIFDTGARVPTPFGRMAVVWRAVE
jgi:hypothetical protein